MTMILDKLCFAANVDEFDKYPSIAGAYNTGKKSEDEKC